MQLTAIEDFTDRNGQQRRKYDVFEVADDQEAQGYIDRNQAQQQQSGSQRQPDPSGRGER